MTFHPVAPSGATFVYFAPTGLPGAASPSRYVGGTVSGAPASGTFAVGDFVVDESGSFWVCTVAGSPGTWAHVAALDATATDIKPVGVQAAGAVGKSADAGHVHPYSGAEVLTSGEATYPRLANNGSTVLTTQQVQLIYWTAATSGACTTVTTYTAGTAASGLTYANIGVYSVAGNGDLTLLQSTGDVHAAAWPGTFSHYTGTLTGTFNRVAGTRYAFGILAVGTGPPALYSTGTNQDLMQTAPLLAGNVPGQATLPATVAHGSVAADFTVFASVVAP